MEKSPLERWLSANQDSPNLDNSLRLLLGHAFVGIFRKTHPDFAVFSPEKALSWVERLPKNAFPFDIGDWIAKPSAHAHDLVHFCENANAFQFPPTVDFSKWTSGVVDLRGVRCPMGSVRARLVLSGMEAGEEITLFVDNGEPIENIPRAMLEDGNHIVSRTREENYWKLTVQKNSAD